MEYVFRGQGQLVLLSLLCCLATRNYFAHHDYRDVAHLNEKSSGFLLGGVLLAVLTLLNSELIKPGPNQHLSTLPVP